MSDEIKMVYPMPVIGEDLIKVLNERDKGNVHWSFKEMTREEMEKIYGR